MMQLISWQFALFVLALFLIYNIVPSSWQKGLLLVASFGLISVWSPAGVGVILISILVNYYIGQRIWDKDQKRAGTLRFGIVFNIGLIILIRILTSKVDITPILNGLFHAKGIDLSWLLPVGYLFYTLQAISYLVDIGQKTIKPALSLLDFALYMAYFPRIISGPIERARDFLPQLQVARVVDGDMLQRAFVRILTGLFRKIVIANALASYLPDNLFIQPYQFNSFQLIFGLIVYSFWIYNDFAGYTDIVRGVSGLFGIELSANFKTPYLATGFTDFWNRWHISLSHWLRDYIYYPLSRSLLRKKISPKSLIYIAVPPIVTMLVSGLWHAFGAYMLAWGLLHGLYQAAEKFFALHFAAKFNSINKILTRTIQILLIYLGVTLAWLPFTSGSLSRVLSYVRAISTSQVTVSIDTMLIPPLYAILLTIVLDFLEYEANHELQQIRLSSVIKYGLTIFAGISLLLSLINQQNLLGGFIYAGF